MISESQGNEMNFATPARSVFNVRIGQLEHIFGLNTDNSFGFLGATQPHTLD